MLPHYQRPVVNGTGDLQSAVVVRVLQPGTNPASNLLVTVPLYTNAAGTVARANPATYAGGLIDFFMDTPQFVQLGVKVGANPEEFYDWVAVNSPVQGYANTPGVGSTVEGPVLEVTSQAGGATQLALYDSTGHRWLVSVDTSGALHVT